MPTLNCYVSERAMLALELAARRLGRTVEDLAESAVEEAAIAAERDNPPGIGQRSLRLGR